jgi:hypothetical protein
MSSSITYARGAELPPLVIQFTNDAGAVVNVTGYTCTLAIARSQSATPVATLTGTGSASGMTINFAAGALDIEPGLWLATAQARNGSGLDYVRRFTLSIV